ncbi:hypothetical protein T484DRAFT_3410057 [Baffinella frigidus]|nr:hypothetical protein T484DRAFT_3410057 [Cryptophyta sp. CCMP2293]
MAGFSTLFGDLGAADNTLALKPLPDCSPEEMEQGLSEVRKKLRRWQLVNHPDKCARPDAEERSAAMNERFAQLEEAVKVEGTRREDERMRGANSVVEARLARRREKEEQERRELAAAAAAEAERVRKEAEAEAARVAAELRRKKEEEERHAAHVREMTEKVATHERSLELLFRAVAPHLEKGSLDVPSTYDAVRGHFDSVKDERDTARVQVQALTKEVERMRVEQSGWWSILFRNGKPKTGGSSEDFKAQLVKLREDKNIADNNLCDQISANKTLRAENQRLQELHSSLELTSSLEVSKLESEKGNLQKEKDTLQKDVSDAESFIGKLYSTNTEVQQQREDDRKVMEKQVADARKKTSALELDASIKTSASNAALERQDDAHGGLARAPPSARPQPPSSNTRTEASAVAGAARSNTGRILP